jgi:hypothetical protein
MSPTGTLHVESALGMELVLNIAWVLLASVMLCLWLRFAPCTHRGQQTKSRRMQFVALAVLLLILFPVISVTDDLQTVQNPAEADSCLRRDHVYSNPHSVFPTAAAFPVPAFAGISFGFLSVAAPGNFTAPRIDHPGLAPIQNRPPPIA